MKTVGICTLGCKVNTYESEYIMNELKKAGYEIGDFNDVCDVYIINTCTVTNASDSKSKKMIRQAIRRNQEACVVAMGCFVAANFDYQENGLDIVLGNKDKSSIVSLLEEYFSKKQTIKKDYSNRLVDFEDMYIDAFPGRTRAFVKIQDGCDNFCSYCIIPFVRGKCRSKDEAKVIQEITDLVNNGYKEIVLTGIHTGSYGVDLDTDFSDLLNKLVNIKGLERLRISSIECTELNDKVLNLIKTSKVIVDHLHIPIQAGSDEILKAMNRKYDLEYFKNKIKEIRKIRPEITKASFLDGKIDNKEKKDRARRLIEVSEELEIKYMEEFINREVEVLVEEHKDGYSIGHTGNFLHVKFKGDYPINEFVTVKIEKVEYPYCIGKVLMVD